MLEPPSPWNVRPAIPRQPGNPQPLIMMGNISLFTVVNIEKNGMTVHNATLMVPTMVFSPVLVGVVIACPK
jgi:hypothetical protein